MTFAQKVVVHALAQLGAPYLWAGRGDYVVRNGLVVPTDAPAFDCAGLVLWAAQLAGSHHDLRGWWGADSLWQHLPSPVVGDWALVFYGRDGHASHVGIDLGRGLILDAGGGDATTLTVADAGKRGAKVRLGFEARADRLGYRSIEALRELEKRPE